MAIPPDSSLTRPPAVDENADTTATAYSIPTTSPFRLTSLIRWISASTTVGSPMAIPIRPAATIEKHWSGITINSFSAGALEKRRPLRPPRSHSLDSPMETTASRAVKQRLIARARLRISAEISDRRDLGLAGRTSIPVVIQVGDIILDGFG